MVTDPAPGVDGLLGKMLNLQLFVIFWRGKGLDMRPSLREHLDYMIALERQGKLFASGPLGTAMSGNGMTIVRAADEDEAQRIAKNDPFVRHGLREFDVQVWTIMEGSLNVTLSFSDRSMQLS